MAWFRPMQQTMIAEESQPACMHAQARTIKMRARSSSLVIRRSSIRGRVARAASGCGRGRRPLLGHGSSGLPAQDVNYKGVGVVQPDGIEEPECARVPALLNPTMIILLWGCQTETVAGR